MQKGLFLAKSLTELPSEYKCHQNFYRMARGRFKATVQERHTNTALIASVSFLLKQTLNYLSSVILAFGKSML